MSNTGREEALLDEGLPAGAKPAVPGSGMRPYLTVKVVAPLFQAYSPLQPGAKMPTFTV